jgi:hypothetical protein
MSATTLTMISGGVLLLVFVLVGWSLQRRRDSDKDDSEAPK